MPDRDFYRKKITSFQSVHSYFESKPLQRSFRERQLLQPHYTALMNRGAPYASAINGQVADGVCAHFLRKGFTKPTKTHFNCALWTSDAKWLVLGTEYGDLATWEGESLKVKKMLSMAPHKVGTGTGPIANTSITAIAKNRHGRMLVTGDANGLYQFCDETFRTSFIKEEAHNGAIHGLSFSPSDSKLVSAGEDAAIHVWTVGQSVPDTTLHGHQSDIKCIEWHPFRSLVASGSRDSAVRLWDPRANGSCVSILTAHKKQVNCLGWNALNGNWLATGAKDGLLKVFDIRKMKPMEVHRGHNCRGRGGRQLRERARLRCLSEAAQPELARVAQLASAQPCGQPLVLVSALDFVLQIMVLRVPRGLRVQKVEAHHQTILRLASYPAHPPILRYCECQAGCSLIPVGLYCWGCREV